MDFSISVIICAYTLARWDALVEAVASVKQQTLLPAEIVVVIDHNDALLARVQAEIKGVIALPNTGTSGLSAARNSGIVATHSPIIAFLDDDAIATPQWLSLLGTQYGIDPQAAGTGGTVVPLWPAETRPAWFPEEFDWVVGCTYRGVPTEETTIRNPIGANMSLRRSVFDSVGGFRTGIGRVGSLPVGCEETELCIRMHKDAPRHYIHYQPAASVFHRVSSERATWRYFRTRCYAEGISKALVSYCVGTQDSLSTESSYISRVLLAGVLRNLGVGLRQRSYSGFARAGAIIAGLALTASGYLIGRFSLRYSHSNQYQTIRTSLREKVMLPHGELE